MFSFGILAPLAFWIASLKLEFVSGSPPPTLAAIMISFMILVKIFPLLASFAPFFRLIVDHLLFLLMYFCALKLWRQASGLRRQVPQDRIPDA
jgi:hypothetical protein